MSKRQIVLDTALDLISKLGFHATPMSLIIKQSGVAAGTIYYYFKSKEELIDTLYSESKQKMADAIIKDIVLDMSYKDKFFLIWKNLFDFYTSHPKVFYFIEDYAHSPFAQKEIKAITQRYYQAAIDFYQSGMETGILRNLPIELLINMIFGQVAVLAKMIIEEEIGLSDDLLNKSIQCTWDSVKIN